MKLFHYTSVRHLHGIGKYGLTVGDVPTNLSLVEGKIGVWLTTSETANGHGLEGSTVDKTEVRMTIELPVGLPLWKWHDWAPRNVTTATIARLEAGREKAARSWFVYFGCIPQTSIARVVSMKTGAEIADWATCLSEDESCPAWPPWQRKAWQRKLLKYARRRLIAATDRTQPLFLSG